MQAIINAGGSGTRLWPISTKVKPKQFAKILDQESLLQKTYLRLKKTFKTQSIWITTNIAHRQEAFDQIAIFDKDFTIDQILTEPERRDTFPAVIAHSAVVASKSSPKETLIFISSDHYIEESDLANFGKTLIEVDKSILDNSYRIVLPATKPYYPATGYGYIKFDIQSEDRVNKVLEFKEKPEQAKAQELYDSGQYYWNLGYFAFSYDNLLKIIKELYPDLLSVLDSIYNKQRIDIEDYRMIHKSSFDIEVLEKAKGIGTIDCNLKTWDDIGSFETIYNYLPKIIKSDTIIELAGDGNKIKMNTIKKVAFIGVSNLLLVETADGIMVIDPKYASSVKEVANWFDK